MRQMKFDFLWGMSFDDHVDMCYKCMATKNSYGALINLQAARNEMNKDNHEELAIMQQLDEAYDEYHEEMKRAQAQNRSRRYGNS